MRPFELISTDKPETACAEAGRGATIKAAGTDLLDRLKERVESPDRVVDILPQKQLALVAADGEGIHLGSLLTLAQLATAKELQAAAFGALRQAAGDAATPQIRNRGTLGGNLLQMSRCWYLRSRNFACAHDGKGMGCLAMQGENRYHSILGYRDCVRVHPSNTAPALFVLGAVVEVQGEKGKRRLPIRELYPRSPRANLAEHTLAADELLTAVHLPVQPRGSRSVYRESREKQSYDWATTAAAVRLVLDGKKILDADICLGAVAPVPYESKEAVAVLVGQTASMELFEKAAAAALAKAEPLSGNGYKVQVGKAILTDALSAAAGME